MPTIIVCCDRDRPKDLEFVSEFTSREEFLELCQRHGSDLVLRCEGSVASQMRIITVMTQDERALLTALNGSYRNVAVIRRESSMEIQNEAEAIMFTFVPTIEEYIAFLRSTSHVAGVTIYFMYTDSQQLSPLLKQIEERVSLFRTVMELASPL